MAYHPYHFVGEVLLHPVYYDIYIGPFHRPRQLLKVWHLFPFQPVCTVYILYILRHKEFL